jgi:hypothetical protein
MNPVATGTAGAPRGGHGWQLILADLALILFLLTLSTLPATEAETGQRLADSDAREAEARPVPKPEIAAAQALFRPFAQGPGLGEWLAAQSPDPRATLTVFATHPKGGEAEAWVRAEALAREARRSGVAVRTIITPGNGAEVYASLAYDTPPQI